MLLPLLMNVGMFGIGLAEEPGIGLVAAPARPPNVDFVYSSIDRLQAWRFRGILSLNTLPGLEQ